MAGINPVSSAPVIRRWNPAPGATPAGGGPAAGDTLALSAPAGATPAVPSTGAAPATGTAPSADTTGSTGPAPATGTTPPPGPRGDAVAEQELQVAESAAERGQMDVAAKAYQQAADDCMTSEKALDIAESADEYDLKPQASHAFKRAADIATQRKDFEGALDVAEEADDAGYQEEAVYAYQAALALADNGIRCEKIEKAAEKDNLPQVVAAAQQKGSGMPRPGFWARISEWFGNVFHGHHHRDPKTIKKPVPTPPNGSTPPAGTRPATPGAGTSPVPTPR